MKPETIDKISILLQREVSETQDIMMRVIKGGSDNGLDVRIAEYRAAYNALEDFRDWLDEQME